MQAHNLLFKSSYRCGRWLLRFFGVIVSVAIFSVICQVGFDFLVFDKLAVREGEYWRLLTGHFTHSSFSHSFWNVLAFSASLMWLGIYSMRMILLAIVVGVVMVSGLLISSWSPLDYYCGLSGILFSPLIIAAYLHARHHKGLINLIPLGVICVKLIVDLTVHKAIFVDTIWLVYPESHLAGAVAGLLVIVIEQMRRNFYISKKA